MVVFAQRVSLSARDKTRIRRCRPARLTDAHAHACTRQQRFHPCSPYGMLECSLGHQRCSAVNQTFNRSEKQLGSAQIGVRRQFVMWPACRAHPAFLYGVATDQRQARRARQLASQRCLARAGSRSLLSEMVWPYVPPPIAHWRSLRAKRRSHCASGIWRACRACTYLNDTHRRIHCQARPSNRKVKLNSTHLKG